LSKQEEIQVKVKEKTVYLSDNKNDMYQKISVDYMKKLITRGAIYTYTGKKPNDVRFNSFLVYLDQRNKPSKSKNDFNYRIERLYNYIISIYSDYMGMFDLPEITTISGSVKTNEETILKEEETDLN
jgi:hypothetical protein